MNREVHVRIWERPAVRILRATRQHKKAGRDRDKLLAAKAIRDPRSGNRIIATKYVSDNPANSVAF